MLLRWGMVAEQAEGGAPENVGVEPLLSVLVLERLVPVDGGEVEDTTGRPSGQQTEEVAEVGPGLDVVELAARQERDEGGVDLGGVVGTDEEPVLAADRFPSQRPLRAIVVDGQAAVVEKALERDPLVQGVADGLRARRLVEDLLGLRLAPAEESIDDRLGLRAPRGQPGLGWRSGGLALDSEKATDVRQRLSCPVGIGFERFPPVA